MASRRRATKSVDIVMGRPAQKTPSCLVWQRVPDPDASCVVTFITLRRLESESLVLKYSRIAPSQPCASARLATPSLPNLLRPSQSVVSVRLVLSAPASAAGNGHWM